MRKLINSLAVRFHIWNQKRLVEALSHVIEDPEYITLNLKNLSASIEASSKNTEMQKVTELLEAVGNDYELPKLPQ